MSYIEFDNSKPLDVIPIGRIAIDFNPTDMNKPLSESSNFNKYVGGSPANIAVGLARLGAKCGFIARVSDDQFGDYVENYFKADGIDVSHVFRCEHGENLGLTFTEILSPTQSSILMYRDGVADLQVCVDDVDEDYIKQAKAVVISGTALCASPSREAALKTLFLAKKNGVVVIFDIDYRSYTWKIRTKYRSITPSPPKTATSSSARERNSTSPRRSRAFAQATRTRQRAGSATAIR